MDLYRYFHPHHNPRLKSTPLRMQEIGELEQAAVELKRALERALVRAGERSVGGIREEHFSEILVAMDYVVDSLMTLTHAHPGDLSADVQELLKERQNAPGWENWTRLLGQRMTIAEQYRLFPESSPPAEPSKDQ